MKRIAILLALAGFVLLSLGGCAKEQSLSDPVFPDDVEFVVVDSLPEDETLSQGDANVDVVFVSATFVDDGSPVCALPVVLYEGDSALFAALTDDSGRVACGSLPFDTAVRFSALVSGRDAVSLSVCFLPSGQSQTGAYTRRDVVVIVPTAQAGGMQCADLLFLLGENAGSDVQPFSPASGTAISPVTDPLHGWSRTTLALS